MHPFEKEARAFREGKAEEAARARQLAAAGLMCGIDLTGALLATPEQQAKLIRRVERVIERERLKGMRRHWSYDLNRHIALKQVLDRLRGPQAPEEGAAVKTKVRRAMSPTNRNGAERRRELFIPEDVKISATACACAPGPSSSPAPSGRRRNWGPPSDR